MVVCRAFDPGRRHGDNRRGRRAAFVASGVVLVLSGANAWIAYQPFRA